MDHLDPLLLLQLIAQFQLLLRSLLTQAGIYSVQIFRTLAECLKRMSLALWRRSNTELHCSRSSWAWAVICFKDLWPQLFQWRCHSYSLMAITLISVCFVPSCCSSTPLGTGTAESITPACSHSQLTSTCYELDKDLTGRDVKTVTYHKGSVYHIGPQAVHVEDIGYRVAYEEMIQCASSNKPDDVFHLVSGYSCSSSTLRYSISYDPTEHREHWDGWYQQDVKLVAKSSYIHCQEENNGWSMGCVFNQHVLHCVALISRDYVVSITAYKYGPAEPYITVASEDHSATYDVGDAILHSRPIMKYPEYGISYKGRFYYDLKEMAEHYMTRGCYARQEGGKYVVEPQLLRFTYRTHTSTWHVVAASWLGEPSGNYYPVSPTNDYKFPAERGTIQIDAPKSLIIYDDESIDSRCVIKYCKNPPPGVKHDILIHESSGPHVQMVLAESLSGHPDCRLLGDDGYSYVAPSGQACGLGISSSKLTASNTVGCDEDKGRLSMYVKERTSTVAETVDSFRLSSISFLGSIERILVFGAAGAVIVISGFNPLVSAAAVGLAAGSMVHTATAMPLETMETLDLAFSITSLMISATDGAVILYCFHIAVLVLLAGLLRPHRSDADNLLAFMSVLACCTRKTSVISRLTAYVIFQSFRHHRKLYSYFLEGFENLGEFARDMSVSSNAPISRLWAYYKGVPKPSYSYVKQFQFGRYMGFKAHGAGFIPSADIGGHVLITGGRNLRQKEVKPVHVKVERNVFLRSLFYPVERCVVDSHLAKITDLDLIMLRAHGLGMHGRKPFHLSSIYPYVSDTSLKSVLRGMSLD